MNNPNACDMVRGPCACGAWHHGGLDSDPRAWIPAEDSLGTYFDDKGMLRNLDGSRSIFDDVDQ